MKNIDNTPKCLDGKSHTLIPRRMRGKKHRSQCMVCNLWTGWRQNDQMTGREKLRKVNAEVAERQKGTKAVAATFWNGATVADLKQMCKERGITGYSKMKRDELLTVLGAFA